MRLLRSVAFKNTFFFCYYSLRPTAEHSNRLAVVQYLWRGVCVSNRNKQDNKSLKASIYNGTPLQSLLNTNISFHKLSFCL